MSNSDWLDRERASITQASHRTHDPKFGPVFVRGLGAKLWDIEGQDYIDFTCGYSAANFGHAFAPLLEVAHKQLCQLTHLTQEPHIWRAPLAEKLIEICGFQSDSAKVHFNATGSRAVETAWKAAMAFRPGRIISLAPSYHGRSLATLALSETTGSFSGLLADNVHERRAVEEFAYCANCSLGLSYPSCGTGCLDSLIDYIRSYPATVSAVIVEPALGARGYVFPPDEYWLRLRQVTDELGVLLIADEIQMGLGRTGAMLLSASQGWKADLVVLGKSLGGGIVPISAVVGRTEVMDSLPVGSESETFACTPFGAAVALEVIAQLKTGPWIRRGVQIGERLRQTLEIIKETHYPGMLVEGRGACAIADFILCHDSLAVSQRIAREFASSCFANRVLVHFTGPLETRIALIPPLTTDDDELEVGIGRLLATV